MNWFWYASPQTFYPLAGRMAPWFAGAAFLLGVLGLYIGFFVAPTDAQQGEVYRIIFIHVPAAWLSMFIYVVMAFWAALGLAFNTRLSGMMASALGPADVGHLLGLGRAADLGAHPALPLPRLHRAAGGDRRPAARRPGGRAARD